MLDKSVERYDENGIQTVFAISPYGNSETREERLNRLEALGAIDRSCSSCRELIEHPTLNAFAPRHQASFRCRSGGHPHCTCDTCF